ncbi:uncharacterized protein L3040_001745 [Drepanopeziza brunnea f. sp. 'multigermtubi']|uniref:F-box domain-containing protein n=1 Tax=Marssonina brunnea f. sp. multigermtubi (strain MB_m1) TaxID=1072389 RepID=K1X3S5_MARBU|nr:uncharacterized protein MBM_06594 [Drepanopeziza brunnea f. sp. 'multigermtubi' MB_m1]EKD15378.1 hypothetical protein MBM_06594 [Drepanopeziza brunnea f. sp. 'multigermtubi' MB_m1]KAJ5051984.1 hypothetical protein L3040_001745 [Drepanopeziza brunnea f. sp. 'multigermtubi']
METLPIELRASVLQYLPLQELKNIRLASKNWALLGENYLMSPSFISAPHRPDTVRLHKISCHPTYARQIISVIFNHGGLNEYPPRQQLHFMKHYYRRSIRDQQSETWKASANFNRVEEKFLSGPCDEAILTDIFSRLPNLREVNVTLVASCPISKADRKVPRLLRDVWLFIPSPRPLDRVAIVERMNAIVRVLSSNSPTMNITSLVHDRLPFEFFAQQSAQIALPQPSATHVLHSPSSKPVPFVSAFRNLARVRLALDYSNQLNDKHMNLVFANLAQCLQAAAPSLRHFGLAILGNRKLQIRSFLAIFAEQRFAFPCLQSIALQGVRATEEELGDFLVALCWGGHGSLKSVRLGGKGLPSCSNGGGVLLERGSWSGLAKRLGREMNGVEVRVQRDTRSRENKHLWAFDVAVDIGELV